MVRKMSAVCVTLSGQATGPLGELAAQHPGVLVEGTPMGGSFLVRCTGEAGAIDQARSRLASIFIARHVLDGADALTLVIEAPEQETRLLEELRKRELLLLPPMAWKEGRLWLRIVAFEGFGDQVVASLLPCMKLESKSVLKDGQVEDELLASGLLLPSLTKRQGQVILAALDRGYYDSPRGSTAGEVAESMGVARSTFEEHLKSAESQIVRALAPLVRVRLKEMELGKGGAGAEALHLYSRYSEDLGLYVSMTLRGGEVAAVDLADQEPDEPHGSDHPYLARIIDHLATGKDAMLDVPLDLPVSGFEREVLELLRTIPPGEVMTYGEIARRLGRPRAMRAVGNACAKNPALVVVPCHRVVPASGGVGNYGGAGGASTKVRLLEKEGALGKVKGRRR
jgi:O-6-methylguanine DNA methyltransferase